jgi:hypothetical protein
VIPNVEQSDTEQLRVFHSSSEQKKRMRFEAGVHFCPERLGKIGDLHGRAATPGARSGGTRSLIKLRQDDPS